MPGPRYIVGALLGGAIASWLWFTLGGFVASATLVPAYYVTAALLGPVSVTGNFVDAVFGLSHAVVALLVAIPLVLWLRGSWLTLLALFVLGLTLGWLVQLALFELDGVTLLTSFALPAFWAPLLVTALTFFLAGRVHGRGYGA